VQESSQDIANDGIVIVHALLLLLLLLLLHLLDVMASIGP
jgi:hypothetical protein